MKVTLYVIGSQKNNISLKGLLWNIQFGNKHSFKLRDPIQLVVHPVPI